MTILAVLPLITIPAAGVGGAFLAVWRERARGALRTVDERDVLERLERQLD